MTSRSSSDDDSGSFPLLCLQTPSTPHQSKSMSSARETLSFIEEGKKHDRVGKCAPCSLYYGCVVKIEAFQLIFLFFVCKSCIRVMFARSSFFPRCALSSPILPKWKIHSINFHFSPIVSGGHIWASRHALSGRILQGEFDVFDFCDPIAPYVTNLQFD